MRDILTDHIVVILIAFLAALGCYTAVILVGVPASRLEDVVLTLGGIIGGVAIGGKFNRGGEK